jgi:hypothetical protein
MNKLFDTLEICLKEVESGAELESVLTRYPDLADELRPILKTAVKAQYAAAPEPSHEAFRRGRARVLQHAAEMREADVVKTKPHRRSYPILQRLALAFSLAAFVMAVSGAGLLNASASSLPGDRLYTLKRSWENVRLLFTLDPNNRSLLESQYYYERLSEVTRLLSEGKEAPVQFAGMFTQAGDLIYVSGVQVIVSDATILPADELTNGAAVLVSGQTNAAGWVDAASIELLPDTAIVPEGMPVPLPTPLPIPEKDKNTLKSPPATNDNVNEDSNINQNENNNNGSSNSGNANTSNNDDNDDDDEKNDDDNNDDDKNDDDDNSNDDKNDDDDDADDDDNDD